MVLPGHLPDHRRARGLRHTITPMEARLWEYLRNRKCAGFKFRRQEPLGEYVADFACKEARLVVELDGESHTDRTAHDNKRTEWLESQGYLVIRFTNAQINDSLEGVLEAIRAVCKSDRSPHLTSPRGRGIGRLHPKGHAACHYPIQEV